MRLAASARTTLLTCLLLPATAGAQGLWKSFALPPAIETVQEIRTPPAGWLPANAPAPHRLAGVTVFDGRPERLAALVQDSESIQEGRKRLTRHWRLAPSSAEGNWLSLSFSGTTFVLNAPLPAGATELRVTYDTRITVAGQYEIVRIEYR